MKEEIHRVVHFNMHDVGAAQKYQQLAKMDDIVKASIKFRQFLKDEHKGLKEKDVFKYIDEEYVRIFKEHGVDV